MRKILLLLTLLSASGGLYAQQTFETNQNIYEESAGIVYDREVTADLKILQTDGFAIGVNIGKIKTYYLTRFLNFEIGELKHPKEYRQSFDFQRQSARVSRAFVFGKQNNLFVLRGGFGEKRYFSEKAKRRGVAVGLSYSGGATLGLLKPYYLELIRSSEPGQVDDFVIRSEKYSEQNANTFLEISRIYGSSGFAQGLGEIRAVPGLHAKFAVHFDWGAFDEFVKALEAGVQADFFMQTMPIMVDAPQVANSENKSLFLNLYINLQFGKRW
ncbi:hypothetical protein [Phaeodactylibacter luteus]|uniref:Uncharacterized protein n=1 Tax=Phaeodactylibacter luteus TaxID=1564516 RepID=A0A5C6RLD9_9BACT|nr:hypothetical protein [Phaeodactylibacter luteus]TXB62142.1 hypothetical protein FRY97_15635 [Phaeodactylibacter luteus]